MGGKGGNGIPPHRLPHLAPHRHPPRPPPLPPLFHPPCLFEIFGALAGTSACDHSSMQKGEHGARRRVGVACRRAPRECPVRERAPRVNAPCMNAALRARATAGAPPSLLTTLPNLSADSRCLFRSPRARLPLSPATPALVRARAPRPAPPRPARPASPAAAGLGRAVVHDMQTFRRAAGTTSARTAPPAADPGERGGQLQGLRYHHGLARRAGAT